MKANYIAVHGGAGAHSRTSDKEVKKALRHACSQALDALLQGNPALMAVENAISVLEDEPCLNAGYGSNLTFNGRVECDAAIMDGLSKEFGSVGVVSGVKNPIQLAHLILQHSRMPDALGRIPPMTLVSDGAHAFAVSHPEKMQVVSPESLVSPRARDQWMKWKDKLESFANPKNNPARVGTSSNPNDFQDTVGAVAYSDRLAAGVSSGGLLLKYPGRMGEAAVFGAGCWAEQSVYSPSGHGAIQPRGMACSVSGAGEHIVRAMLARSIGNAFNLDTSEDTDVDTHEVLRRVLVDGFWKPCRDRGELEPNAGVLLITVEDDGKARLWCAFTTPSMAIAYASSGDPTPKVSYSVS